jgi:uncharacterized cupredoxin-like copper-binding protein
VTRAVAAAALAAVALTAAGCAREAAASEPRDRTVVLRIHHSRFSPASFTVREGSTVRFVVHNDDPIDHELIVGDAAVQLRHELGTEPWHPPRPGEVSIAAGSLASTTYTFAARGHTEFACHMPGHYAYGMRGMVTVTS